MKHFKTEPYMPSKVIDRHDRKNWEDEGSKTIFERAQEKVRDIKANHVPLALDSDRDSKLDAVVREVSNELGLTGKLPQGPQ